MKLCQNFSLVLVRPKPVPNNLFHNFLRYLFSSLASQAGIVGSRQHLYVTSFYDNFYGG